MYVFIINVPENFLQQTPVTTQKPVSQASAVRGFRKRKFSNKYLQTLREKN